MSNENRKQKLNFSIGFGFFLTIVSLFLFVVPVYGAFSILGILFSVYGMGESKKKYEKGKVLAMINIVLGALVGVPNIFLSLRMWLQ